MKTILTGFLLLLFSIAIGQSNLSNAEYYIDHDPGYGQATSLPITGDTAFINEIISNTLELGFHTIYMRIQDDQGNWGMDEAVSFLIKEQWVAEETFEMDYAEYYFNHDPGYGMATEISVTTGDTIFISEILINDLSPGFNTLFIRSRNANNKWGIDEAFTFYIQEDYTVTQGNQDKIVGLEYFIGDDPGNGAGIYVALDPGDTLQIEEWLASQTLADGVHQLSIRLQSDSGTWGLTEWREFEYLNCEDEIVSVSGETEFCTGDSILIQGPNGYDLWSWNTHENDSQIYATQSGDYFVSVLDSANHQCFLSDTLNIMMFLPPDASSSITSSFNTIEASAQGEGQDLFWQLNDEYSSTEASFNYTFISDGWQSICLEASNICGVEEICDTIITCSAFETAPFFYFDFDEDGYGTDSDSLQGCETPVGYADNMLDCDDDDDSIYPGAEEIPDDGIDQDCDGEDLVTGLNEIDGNAFYYFPNPAKDKINIHFSTDFSGIIEIYNSTGKRMRTFSNNNSEEIILNLENLIPGLYFLQLTIDNKTAIKKLIIQ
ncbi:MAG: hypothetical protein DRI54_00425 [Bacteroidetes bacterium]|nr:MAG: hypothetical protein DRI54_00425 [Bacteroidota bacterium]